MSGIANTKPRAEREVALLTKLSTREREAIMADIVREYGLEAFQPWAVSLMADQFIQDFWRIKKQNRRNRAAYADFQRERAAEAAKAVEVA